MISRKMNPGVVYKIDISVTAPGLTAEEISIYNVQCIDFKLHADPKFNNSRYFSTSTFIFTVIPEGKISRTLHIQIDGNEMTPISLGANQYTNGKDTYPIEIETYKLSPGVHTITAYLKA
jgi:hypothetical protein